MEALAQATESQNKIRDYQTTVTILEHLSDAVFILNPEGNIQYANRVATDLLGKPFADILGKNLNDFLKHPFAFNTQAEVKAEERSFLKDIYSSGLKEIENEFKSQGYQIPVLFSFGIIRNKNGGVQYMIASAKDLSLRKNLEKERLQKQLLAQSRDRYRELGELAINIVHRLSQPITSIQLLTDIMQKSLQAAEIDKTHIMQNLEEIREMLNGMSEVINSVRNFAFLTEEKTLKPVRLEKVLEEALQQLHYELTEADLSITIRLPDALPGVLGNALHLQQVFLTLIRIFLKGAARTNSSNALTIAFQNIQNHWIEVALYQGERPPLSFAQNHDSLSLPTDDNLNLTVIQLILTSIGGDFTYFNQDEQAPAFLLRLPADQQNERDMLLNLIELMK